MVTLYLLVVIVVGQLAEVLRRVREVPHVAEVEVVTGPFDLIIKLKATHINEALDVVMHRIRRIPGIKSTETLITVTAS